MTTTSRPPTEQRHLRRIGLISLGVLLVVLAVAWLSRPPLATGTVLDFNVDRISDDYPSVQLQLSMAGYVALADDGVAIYDVETGKTAASDGYTPPEDPAGVTLPTPGTYQRLPEVIQISEDGSALAREDTSSDTLHLTRLTEDGEQPVAFPDELWRGESPNESEVLASAPDRLTVAGCLYDDTAVVAGLDPTDLSVQWRRESSTEYCALSATEATTGRYTPSPLDGYGRALSVLDTHTGRSQPLPVGEDPQVAVSTVVHEDTAAALQGLNITGVDAATGHVRWRASVCQGQEQAGLGRLSQSAPVGERRYVVVTCQRLGAPDDGARSVVVDLADGQVSPPVAQLEQQSQSYLDGGEAPDYDEQTVDDFDREVSPLLVDGIVVTRIGTQVTGADPFSGDELWVRDLDLDEQHVVSVSGAGFGDDGMVEVAISGDERRETMLWDAADGSTLVHTRGDDQSLLVNDQGQVLLDGADSDYGLVLPAGRP